MENPQSYTHEFKAEAVKLVLNQGLSLGDAAKRLSIPNGTLTNRVSNAKGGVVASAPGARSVPELEAEVRQMRRDLTEARMERDILKNRPPGLVRAPMNRNRQSLHLIACTDSGRLLFGGIDPVKKHGPGEAADPTVAAHWVTPFRKVT